ncbi:Bro-N domain-containing protein [Kitasatospora sp. A2-31]|uniref:BRO-N domain-containing protein n=1 Tax=Kitasatospora sp. A2-31 TaxID=2916414 RepID=UPI001EEB7F42|nr:Bro-N domain-containing protein [Kitasatospora sp. A2-31]MCG6494606.1 Bro-N domain-containing protein [Kitasatospora sp. A2-31]
MGDEQEQQERMVLVRSSFPVTGQPIRVVMIDGKPWFVTADVCRVLGRLNPSRVRQVLGDAQTRVINSRSITLTAGKVNHVSAGGKPYERGNPMLNVISEAGLYTLIMRSNKPNARPFQEWVTQDLLPSVRRGDTDVPTQQRRMAETLTDAIGQQVRIVARIDHEDWPGVTIHSDGTVHCRHGEMVFQVPDREEDSGPPFGGYYSCPAVERVGIRGSRVLPGCPKLRLVDLIRLRRAARPEPVAEPAPPPDRGLVYADLHGARIYGSPPQIAELMRAYGG